MVRYFKPGDKVQLKSGGPIMTVLKYIEEKEPLVGTVESDQFVECEWFDKDGPHREVFNQNALIKVNPNSRILREDYNYHESKLYGTIKNMMEQEEKGIENASTLYEALKYLNEQGYKSEFMAGPEGLVEISSKKLYKPEEVKIVKIFRFEGFTDIDDMSVLYALETNDGKKGWIADAYGVYANPYLQSYIDRIEVDRNIKG